ncbi:acylneuraminate cytidylyltransferase family protein [Flavobacterium selenitireducens]|uniref:acylneuraminate cytidylyltransferase family protein n=1 Tax=Flavobacterium selenitireducens TaxID=2722704 RepID=UPI00168BC4C8|nr:acylneuraminate cytidylyltransferase family protein [Flavobacterium selenitireducens]MBD3583435.1 acylneuraminate cytidylyltransferase family protein [Flavobacterium selenitireducens]
MKTIVVIPARGGSKRLPGKNLMALGGLPLIAHSILYAKANPDIVDGIFVSTDDADIASASIAYGAQIIERPESISGDHEPTVTAVAHVLEVLSERGHHVENVILLQPTNPLRPDRLLGDCFSEFKNRGFEGVFTVSRNSDKLGKIENDKFLPFNYVPGQRSQDLEPLYRENGLLYICRAETIRSGKIISEASFPFVADLESASVDIDTQADFDWAEYLILKQKNIR